MTGGNALNIFVPLAAVPGLSVPPVAITDGSADPSWVALSASGGFVYGRAHLLLLPLDAGTAAVARRGLRFERLQRSVLTPISLTLLSAALVLLLFADEDRFDGIRLTLYAAGILIQLGVAYAGRKLTVVQNPELIGRSGYYLRAVSAEVAAEWVRRNPGVRVMPERPRWRRFPAVAYGWAAGLSAGAAAAVWWFGLSDGEADLTTLAAFGVLAVGAVVSAFKALPLGYIRFDDTGGPR